MWDVTILRLIHIFGAVVWVGFGLFLTIILMPTLQHIGAKGYSVYHTLESRFPVGTIMGVSSLSTTLAGMLLYLRLYGLQVLPTLSGAVLAGGALAGLLAFGHGSASLGRLSGQLSVAIAQWVGTGGDNTPVPADLTALYAKVVRHSRISLLLMVIALAGMASARHLY
jgi:hypothetical protein